MAFWYGKNLFQRKRISCLCDHGSTFNSGNLLRQRSEQEDLVVQINELATKGIITKDLKDWATAVRWIGNDAAHPAAEVTKDDAEDILKLAEQFLHVIYVAPAIAKELADKKGKKL